MPAILRLLLAVATLLFLPLLGHAQTVVRWDWPPGAQTLNIRAPQPGAMVPVLSLPFSTVQICATWTVGNPACTSLATTYTTATGAACPTTTQLTPPLGGSCTNQVDTAGNLGAWIAVGSYAYVITTSYGAFGPYPFTVGGGGGGGGSPGGGSFAAQFNNGGTFGGDSNILINPSTHSITAPVINSVVYASGMACNGSTNDTTAFLAAYNSLPAVSPAETTLSGLTVRYGEVDTPPGTCIVNPLIIGPHVLLASHGGQSTTLQLPSGTSGTTPTITSVSAPVSNVITVTGTNFTSIPGFAAGYEVYLNRVETMSGTKGNLTDINGPTELLVQSVTGSTQFTAKPLFPVSLTNGALSGGSALPEVFVLTIDPANPGSGNYNVSYASALKNVSVNGQGGYSEFGGASYGGYNSWSSGINWAGAQFSTLDNGGVNNVGIRGILNPRSPISADASLMEVPTTAWVIGALQGPGIQNNGLIHGNLISCEHVNPSGTYIEYYDGAGDPYGCLYSDGSGTTGETILKKLETEVSYTALVIKNPTAVNIGNVGMLPQQTTIQYPTGILIKGNTNQNVVIGNWNTFATSSPAANLYTNAVVDRVGVRTIPSVGNFPSGSYTPSLVTNTINYSPVNPLVSASTTTTSVVQYFLLATLSAPVVGYQPGVTIHATVGGWGAQTLSIQDVTVSNSSLGTVNGAWIQSGVGSNTLAGIRVYQQAGGTATVWLFVNQPFGYGTAAVVSQQQSQGTTVTINPAPITPQSSTPTGTLLFDTTTPATYPPTPTVAGISITPTTVTASGTVTAPKFLATGTPLFGVNTTSNNDVTGQITLSGGTGSFTFAGTYTNAVNCVCTDSTATNVCKASATNTTLTLTGTGTDVITYVCVNRQ